MDGVLPRLVHNVRAAAARGRRVEAVGPFEAFLSPASDDYLLSFAVPVEDRTDWAAALPDLRLCFSRHRRLLRLEFFAELHPGLASALEQAGLLLNMTAPVMVAEPGTLAPGRDAAPDWRLLSADDEGPIAEVLAVQARAFGLRANDAGHADWRLKMIDGLRTGAMRVAAGYARGRMASAAVLLIGAGSAELAGVGTVPEARRQGLAAGLCHALLAGWFAEGGRLAWLSAGPEAQRLYRRLGFRVVGTQFNYGVKRL